MSQGVFGVDRGIWDHPLFEVGREPFSRLEAWLWLLSEACWKERRVRIAGATVTIDRGQLSHSLRYMAHAWGWSKSKVEWFLGELRNETMIRTDNGTGQNIITICNYDLYQVVALPSRTENRTENRTATGQQQDKEEELKKERIDDDGKVASLISPEAYELANELGSICGHPSPDLWPPGWYGSPLWVQKCLNEGWSPDVMRAETRAAARRKRDGPIEHFRYLEKPLAQAQARHRAPLPKVETPQQEVIHSGYQRRDGITDFQRALGKLRDSIAEDDRSQEIGGHPAGLIPHRQAE